MGDSAILPKVFLLVAAMAAIAVIEILIPLRLAAGSRRSRWPGNLALTAVFLAMNLALTAGLLGALLWMEQHRVGLFHWISLPGPLALILGIVILDLAAYAVHVCMHKTPALWRVHRVHHSDRHVDVTTSYRQHPLETVLRFLFTAAPALLLGVSPAALALYRLLSGINALFEHANLRVAPKLDRALRWAVVTPHFHKIHHSRLQRETDSNYGNILSVYDRAFGSYTPPDALDAVVYGLDDVPATHRFSELLRMPWGEREQEPAPEAARAMLGEHLWRR